MVEMLEIMLTAEGHQVVTAGSTEEAIHRLEEQAMDLVISDIKIPKEGGIAVLRASLQNDRERPVIMITAYASAESAVEAMKLGAYDYITKPFNVDELKLVVRNALERRGLILENLNLKKELRARTGLAALIGGSAVLANTKDLIARVAESASTVLITGESGTGKELAVRAIHSLSPRADKPLLSINCGAMPEHLLESELFGHKKGSFTGAIADKPGLLETAKGGTFFLDEVGEMPLSLQVKLVRAIQEREIRRVGDVVNIKVDVRFVAATNKDLAVLVKEGLFREDLYYRLNVVSIEMPPLRNRREDIPVLAKHFLQKFAGAGQGIQGISPEAMRLLEEYRWPGNVRELENAVERAVVLETGKWISADNLPEICRHPSADRTDITLPPGGFDLEKKIEEIEKRLVISALAMAGGSKKRAAGLLNMNLRQFRYKLEKYDVK